MGAVPSTRGPERTYLWRTSCSAKAVFMVEVHDDEGKHIADATFTMFYTGATLDDMKH